MADHEQGPSGRRRTLAGPKPNRWARFGIVSAQVVAALIILAGMQYLLRELVDLILRRGT